MEQYKYSVGASAVEDRINALTKKELRDKLFTLLRERWAGAWFMFPKKRHAATPICNRFITELNTEMLKHISVDETNDFWAPLLTGKFFYVRYPERQDRIKIAGLDKVKCVPAVGNLKLLGQSKFVKAPIKLDKD